MCPLNCNSWMSWLQPWQCCLPFCLPFYLLSWPLLCFSEDNKLTLKILRVLPESCADIFFGGADYVPQRLHDIDNNLCSFTLNLPPPGIAVTNSNSSRNLTCLHASTEIRTTSLPQPAIYTTPSQAVIIIQIHSIAKVEGGGGGLMKMRNCR